HTQDSHDRSPEGGVGDAEQVEADSKDDAVGSVEQNVQNEVAADAPGGLVHGPGHYGDASAAGEEQQAVAEVLVLHQHVKGEDEDHDEHSNRFKERERVLVQILAGGWFLRDNADGDGLIGFLQPLAFALATGTG